MNEDFVTYEQAVKLKELGFDWECNHYYNVDHVLCENINDLFSNYIGNTYYQDHNNDNDWPTICSAPTLSQAQHWMLEKFDLWIEVTRDTIETKRFSCEINHADDVYREWIGIFDNIFDALSEGINKAIELLKEN